jgi:hypothetical protein
MRKKQERRETMRKKIRMQPQSGLQIRDKAADGQTNEKTKRCGEERKELEREL